MPNTEFLVRQCLLLVIVHVVMLVPPACGEDPVVLRGHAGAVMAAAFAANSQRVVTASTDQTAGLWDVATATRLAGLTQHTGPLYCLAVSPDGRMLVTGAQDNTLRAWDLPLAGPIRLWKPSDPGSLPVRDFVLSDEGTRLTSAAADSRVWLFDAEPTGVNRGEPQPHSAIRSGHDAPLTTVAARSDNFCFASGDSFGNIMLWSPELDSPIGRLRGSSHAVTALAFTAGNQQLISADAEGLLRVWQLMPALPRTVATLNEDLVGLEIIPGQPLVVVASRNGHCRLLNALTGEIVREFPQVGTEVSSLAVSPDASFVAIAAGDGVVRLFAVSDGSSRGLIAGHAGPIPDVVIHPDSRRIFTAGADGTVRSWNPPGNSSPLTGHGGRITGLISAANGQWCATISDDQQLRIWNADGAGLRTLSGHQHPMTSISVSHDDAFVVSGDRGGVVRIWNPSSGTADGVVQAHTSPITTCLLTVTRDRILTAAEDGTIRSWRMPLPSQLPASGESGPVPEWEFRSPDTMVTQMVTLDPDGLILAVTGTGTQILRVAADGTPQSSVAVPSGVIRTLDIASARDQFLATTDTGQIHVFSRDGTLRQSLPPIQGLTSARFDQSGSRLVVTRNDPGIRILNLNSGQLQEELTAPYPVIVADWTGPEQTRVVAAGSGTDALVQTQSLTRLTDGFAGGATALACSRDQQSLFCAAADGTIRNLQLSDGTVTRTLSGPAAAVRDLTVSSSGQWLATASTAGTLGLLKSDGGEPLHVIAGPGALHSVSVTPDDHRVAVAGGDHVIRVYDTASGRLLEMFPEHAVGTAVNQIRWMNDGQSLLSCGSDGSLRMWRSSVLKTLPLHSGAITGLAVTNGGNSVVTCGADHRILATSIASGSPEREFSAVEHVPMAVAVRPDHQRIAAAGADGTVQVWTTGSGPEPRDILTVSSGQVLQTIAWSADNRRLAVSTESGLITILGPSLPGAQSPAELVVHQQFNAGSAVSRILFRPDGRSLLVGTGNGDIEEWTVAGPEQRLQLNHGGPVYSAAISHDGTTIVSAGADQSVRVWDAASGQQRFQLNGHSGAVHSVALSQDDAFAVSSGADGTLRLWDLAGGRAMKQLIRFDETMYSVAIHPGGAVAAAAGADRKIHLLDLASGTEQQILSGHTDYIHSVTFSPDGQRLLSCGYAGHVKVWNSADGRPVFETQVGRIGNTAAFSPDGQWIVVGSGDGTATVLRLP